MIDHLESELTRKKFQAMATAPAFLSALPIGANHRPALLGSSKCPLNISKKVAPARIRRAVDDRRNTQVVTAKIFDWKKRQDPDYGKGALSSFFNSKQIFC